MTTFDQRNQQLQNQYNADNISFYQHVPFHQIDPAILAKAERQLAALPLKTIPDVQETISDIAPILAGSRLPAHNSFFVGRKASLQALAATLKGDNKKAVNQIPTVAVTGMGGVGKTQLASEFVHLYGQYFAGGVFWLSFADASAVQAEVAACHAAINLGMPLNIGSLRLDDQVRLVLSAWQSRLPRLLVFDNCEDEILLAQWRPPAGGCRVLVTSHRPKWAPELEVNILPLDELSREESIDLLRKHRPDLSTDDLRPIADVLGNLPLALHLAGRFLDEYHNTNLGTPETYLRELHQVALRHSSLQGRGAIYSATGHEQNVERTFALSYERLDADDRIDMQALGLLARAAYFAPGEPIPRDLLLATLKQEDSTSEAELQIEDALKRLLMLGFLEIQSSNAFRLHRLLAEFVRMRGVNANEAQRAVEQVILERARRLNDEGYPLPMLVLQPHLRVMIKVALKREDERAAALSNELGRHLRMVGAYNEAQSYMEQALEIRQKALGAEHPDMAQILSGLAKLYAKQDRDSEAEEFYRQALAIQEQSFGPVYPKTTILLDSYANLLRKMKRKEEAAALEARAIAIRANPLS